MACNVCGEKVEVCDNCLVELVKSEFNCYKGAHFCGEGCWKEWIIEEETSSLEEAEDDEEEV